MKKVPYIFFVLLLTMSLFGCTLGTIIGNGNKPNDGDEKANSQPVDVQNSDAPNPQFGNDAPGSEQPHAPNGSAPNGIQPPVSYEVLSPIFANCVSPLAIVSLGTNEFEITITQNTSIAGTLRVVRTGNVLQASINTVSYGEHDIVNESQFRILSRDEANSPNKDLGGFDYTCGAPSNGEQKTVHDKTYDVKTADVTDQNGTLFRVEWLTDPMNFNELRIIYVYSVENAQSQKITEFKKLD